jgi:putative hydrolase of the HAD superfamily
MVEWPPRTTVFSPKALLFDFGGTLDANGQTWLERARLCHGRAGIPLTPAFDRAFYDADDRLARRHRLEGLDLAAVVELQVRDTLSNLDQDLSKAPAIAAAFTAESRSHLAASKKLLERWKGRYRIGIVSNFYGNMRSLLKAEGLAGLVDAVADSSEVGALKPDAAIFEAALEELGVAAGEAVMVGDSLARDMRGAEALEMPHAWLSGGKAAPACCDAAAILRTLSDLDGCLNHLDTPDKPKLADARYIKE